jgi:hypothetical protein
LAEEGDAAGCNVPASATCGVDWSDGNAGAAERATTEESSDASFGFHHAQRGLDWQPANPVATRATINARVIECFMFVPFRLNIR